MLSTGDDYDPETSSTSTRPSTSQPSTTQPSSPWIEIQNHDLDSVPLPIVFCGPPQGPTVSLSPTITPVEMFQHFLSDDLLQFIVDETNR